MKKKILALIIVFMLVFAFGFSTSTMVFADEIPEETTETTEEVTEETEETPMTNEELDRLANILVDKIQGTTGLTKEDVSSISSKIYELLGGKVSEAIIVIVICILALGITIAGVYITKSIKLKASNKEITALKTQYNNLAEFLESFEGDKVSNEVVEAVQHLIDGVKNADTQYLSKIEGELKTMHEMLKAEMKAMAIAWGNKVAGVNEVLSKAPEQSAVDADALYIKQLEEIVRKTHSDDAEALLVELKKKAGV